MNHKGTVMFETTNLICRRFTPYDCHDMLRNWASDPQIQTEYREPVYSDINEVSKLLSDYIENYQNPDYYRWAIIEKTTKENIGQIALCRVYSDCGTGEIEYCIGKHFWGRGYAGEALSGMIAYIFRNTEFQKLEAYHRAENIKSGRVLQKSAMKMTDNVERFAREKINPHGEICYCIYREEYLF